MLWPHLFFCHFVVGCLLFCLIILFCCCALLFHLIPSLCCVALMLCLVVSPYYHTLLFRLVAPPFYVTLYFTLLFHLVTLPCYFTLLFCLVASPCEFVSLHHFATSLLWLHLVALPCYCCVVSFCWIPSLHRLGIVKYIFGLCCSTLLIASLYLLFRTLVLLNQCSLLKNMKETSCVICYT
jgi:hypothetical protein